jgi:UDP-2-acetamido-3-amino-2,3-dideoxy-glucuronate N-acetyltransferase
MLHPSSEIQTKAIGKGTIVWQNCVILESAIIGCDCNICYNVFIENDVIIGNNVTIKSGVQIWDRITIEDNVFLGPNATFTNDTYPRSGNHQIDSSRTIIKYGASIGANASVLNGITIGKCAMIGAGSVVTKNIPDYTLWYGNPAKLNGYICECGKKLDLSLCCTKCNRNYRKVNDLIEEY